MLHTYLHILIVKQSTPINVLLVSTVNQVIAVCCRVRYNNAIPVVWFTLSPPRSSPTPAYEYCRMPITVHGLYGIRALLPRLAAFSSIRSCVTLYDEQKRKKDPPEAILLAAFLARPFPATGRPRRWIRGPARVGGLRTSAKARRGRGLRLCPTRLCVCPTCTPRVFVA